jgi:hypothetical protein
MRKKEVSLLEIKQQYINCLLDEVHRERKNRLTVEDIRMNELRLFHELKCLLTKHRSCSIVLKKFNKMCGK